ncbi:MAG: hypothetical protein KDA55_00870, partial [Planctomycetales bacterium]|nr:hypothetical protein [Planctomycetales bacterium]
AKSLVVLSEAVLVLATRRDKLKTCDQWLWRRPKLRTKLESIDVTRMPLAGPGCKQPGPRGEYEYRDTEYECRGTDYEFLDREGNRGVSD